MPDSAAGDGAVPRVLSIFSGAGGLDLGLEAAGFRIIGCVELDADARATLSANRPGWRILEPYDINELAKSLVPRDLGLRVRELDVVAGGVPCQPYSKAAQWLKSGREGIHDPRSHSLHAFMSIVRTFLPRVVLIENVAGFVSGPSSALHSLRVSFGKINSVTGTRYKVDWRVLDASAFGVPQRRLRGFVVAMRGGTRIAWPEPTHLEAPVTAWDALHDVELGEVPKSRGYWSGLLPSIPEGHNYIHHTEEGGGLPLFGYRTRFWSFLLKLSRMEPAWTLPASTGPATGPFHWDNRPLAPSEVLRLQSFPKDWVLSGPNRARLRQAGNATPPLLAEVVGRAVATTLFRTKYSPSLHLQIPRAKWPPAPSAVGTVPHKFLVHVGIHAPHPGEGLGPRPVGGATAEAPPRARGASS